MEIERQSEESAMVKYYKHKIDEMTYEYCTELQNQRRLISKRNQLNDQVRRMKEELQLLSEPSCSVGEVIRAVGKDKVLVKSTQEGKYVVKVEAGIDIRALKPNQRVALKSDTYSICKVLPNQVDPLISLMRVEKVPDSTYDMIGGLDQQIKEIKEVIELPIKHPELFESLGIAQPKGVLLYGPPGTGKTLLARAVAHHTDCTFIRVSGTELVQKYILLFLVNQLDGFEPTKNIKVLMATNRIDILDPALLRPGRIDRKIEFPNPKEEARLDILKIHSKKMNLVRGIDLKKIAERLDGASGAEIKACCTEAGMFALRERRSHVTQEDFELAAAKVMKKDNNASISLQQLWK
ncbi:26S protease regulatory subunit putative [Entamoeba histolytica]|uniref:26S protease regulatory subunit putative n=1 Tax=Entamoeba histolytica TaxID=5759 RepID=A0A175JX39_ENTHI|nr:26S protease regulatory subunit putative [Entamoeba histolytica]